VVHLPVTEENPGNNEGNSGESGNNSGNNGNNSGDTFTPVTYSFISYLDSGKTNQWGTGTAKTTGITSNNFIQLQVVTNEPEDPNNPFIGKKIFVNQNAPESERTYKLYESTENDAVGSAIDVWVEINQ
jgi:hypothetical protein